jgi:hypothetical protein
MACIVKWAPSSPGADGVVLAEPEDAVRYVMEKLDLAERQTASILLDADTLIKIPEIAVRYRHLICYEAADDGHVDDAAE